MAKIVQRVWTTRGPTGKRVKHVAWGYTLMVNGTREKKFSSAWQTETEALAALIARRTEADAGGLSQKRDRTFGEVAEAHLKTKRDAKKRSVADDERIVRKCLLPAFGPQCRLRAVTREMIAQYRDRRLGEGLSPYTVSNELSVLRHLLRCAQEVGDLDTVPSIKLPKKPEGRLRFLDPDEIGRLLAACAASRNHYLGAVVTLAVHTGMRKGEILGLEWERVNLSTARITLLQTKSGKPRGIPIGRAVYDTLVTLEPDPTRRQGRVFPNGNDRRGSQIRTAFATALARASITGFRFHDLRHTAASHLVMRGASLKDVQELLGHSDVRMTIRYAHLSPDHLRSAVDRLDGLTARPVLTTPSSPASAVEMAHDLAHSV